MLPQQGGGVVEGIAERDEDEGIGKQLNDFGNARYVGVVFREIAHRLRFCLRSQGDHLSEVGFDERPEFPMNVLVGRRPCSDAIVEVFLGPKRPPHDFFKRLGAVKADGHAVAVSALDNRIGCAKAARKGVPQERNEQKRHVPIGMRGEYL